MYYQNVQLFFICFLCCAKESQIVENIGSNVVTLETITTMKNRR